jgi:hypothetical protein
MILGTHASLSIFEYADILYVFVFHKRFGYDDGTFVITRNNHKAIINQPFIGVIKEDSKFLQAESRRQNRIPKPCISLIFFNYLRPPIQCVLQVTKLIRLSVRPYTYNGNNNVTSNPA